jgi:hypothetical protein
MKKENVFSFAVSFGFYALKTFEVLHFQVNSFVKKGTQTSNQS